MPFKRSFSLLRLPGRPQVCIGSHSFFAFSFFRPLIDPLCFLQLVFFVRLNSFLSQVTHSLIHSFTHSLIHSFKINYSRYFFIITVLFSADFALCNVHSPISLLARYQNLHPFYETIKKPDIDEECKTIKHKKHCQAKIVWKDDPQKFNGLLQDTESTFNTKDKEFLSSHLGEQYTILKNFMKIHQSLKSCSDNAEFWTQSQMTSMTDQFIQLSSKRSLEQDPLCQEGEYEKTALPSHNINHKITDGSRLESAILMRALKDSVQSVISLNKKFQGLNIHDPKIQNKLIKDLCRSLSCNEEEKNLIVSFMDSALAHEKNQPTAEMTPKMTAKDINERLKKINAVLEEYNKSKKNLEENWAKEDAQKTNFQSGRKDRERIEKTRQRKNQLAKMKESAFNKYRQLFIQLHFGDGAGMLMSTQAVIDKINIMKGVEDFDPKALSFFGFDKKVLTHNDDFPLLEEIDKNTAKKAGKEALHRMTAQVKNTLEKRRARQTKHQDYLSELDQSRRPNIVKAQYHNDLQKSIEDLAIPYSADIGDILLNQPEYSYALCAVLQNIAKDKRNAISLEATAYAGVGGLMFLTSMMTLGSSLPFSLLLAAFGVEVLFTGADYTYQKIEQSKRLQFKEQMLNSYLADSRNNQKNLAQIREEWNEILEIEYAANVTLGTGVFGAMLIGPIRRAGAIIRMANKLDNFDHSLPQNKQLLQDIVSNDSQVNTIHKIMKHYDREEVGEMLSFIGTLSPNKQKGLMKQLGNTKSLTPANLENLSQTNEINKLLSPLEKANFIKAIRKKYEVVLPDSSKRIANKILKNYAPILQKLTPKEQGVIMTAVAVMVQSGRAQVEIGRSLSNVLPIPDSLPKSEEI